jgi:hypothetical protein
MNAQGSSATSRGNRENYHARHEHVATAKEVTKRAANEN